MTFLFLHRQFCWMYSQGSIRCLRTGYLPCRYLDANIVVDVVFLFVRSLFLISGFPLGEHSLSSQGLRTKSRIPNLCLYSELIDFQSCWGS